MILGLNFDKHINFGRAMLKGQLYAVNNLVGVQRHLNITKDDYIVMMMPEENRWDLELRYSTRMVKVMKGGKPLYHIGERIERM